MLIFSTVYCFVFFFFISFCHNSIALNFTLNLTQCCMIVRLHEYSFVNIIFMKIMNTRIAYVRERTIFSVFLSLHTYIFLLLVMLLLLLLLFCCYSLLVRVHTLYLMSLASRLSLELALTH